MSKPTDLPIHEVILKIMYYANKEKPAELSAKDILWKIDNPEITERYVREVLNWLVREKKVQLYLDKYSLDRYEFLDQKQKNDEDDGEDVVVKGNEAFYIKPSKKKIKNKRSLLLFVIGLLALFYMTYLYLDMNRNYEISTKTPVTKSVVSKQKSVGKLFVSAKETTIEEKVASMTYLFHVQNTNNDNFKKEITKLYKLTDSLQKQQQLKLNQIQKDIDTERNESINYMNDFTRKLVYSNLIFLFTVIIVFFKGKI